MFDGPIILISSSKWNLHVFPDYAIFLQSLSLCLAEDQVLVDTNLLIMTDYVVVEHYVIEKQHISAC